VTVAFLRPELVPPNLDPERVEYLTQLAAHIFQYLFLHLDAQPLIEHFTQLTNCAPDLLEQSLQLHGTDPREFVERLLAPRPGRIPGLTHTELSELIRRITTREGQTYEIAFWSDVWTFISASPLPSFSIEAETIPHPNTSFRIGSENALGRRNRE
jgi:hypothetical protein